MAEEPPFLRLPTEIRLQIYGHLYEPPEGQYPIEASFPIWGSAPIWLHRLELCHGDLHPACESTKRAFWSILQVCKVTNLEVLDLLFERLLFTIFIPDRKKTSVAEAPKLGRARAFVTFWQRARRILLVSIDEHDSTIRNVVWTLGKALRNFKSTPQDTAAYLYLHNEREFGETGGGSTGVKEWEGLLKSFSSLSKRAKMGIEVRSSTISPNGREKAFGLAEAANASVSLISVQYRRSRIPRTGEQECAESTETLRDGRQPDEGPGADALGKNRVVCCMSSSARFQAGRVLALKRRQERMLVAKRMYEGRLG